MFTLNSLIDDAKCYRMVRQLRWSEGISCPHCESIGVSKRGKDDTQPERQRYVCKSCGFNFDDLTNTIFAGHHQPLRQWIGCLYLMGLNLSSQQIAAELDLDKDDVYTMTMQLRSGIVCRQPEVKLSAEVECDEMYLNAGHKGKGEVVKKKVALDGDTVSKGFAVVAPWQKKSRQSLA